MPKCDCLCLLTMGVLLFNSNCFADVDASNGRTQAFAIGSSAKVDGLNGFYSTWNNRYLTDKETGVYSAIRSNSFSEVMSIDAIADHFRGPLEPGEVAVTHNSAEAGIVINGWRIARVWRYDYVLKFSEDTAYLNFQLEQGGSASLDLDYPYDIYLQADHIRSQGFLVGKTFPIMVFKPGLLDIELAWMQSTQFYDGYIDGTFQRGSLTENSLDEFAAQLDFDALDNVVTAAEAIAEAEALQLIVNDIRQLIETSDLGFETDYAYYRPGLREDEIASLEDIRAIDARGKGFSLSFELFMPINDRWTIQVGVRDLISAIRWRDVGNTQGNLKVTQGSGELLDIVDQVLQEDIINRFSGFDFSPINPDNPSDPEPAIAQRVEEIQAEYANVSAYKGTHTQHLPRQYQLAAYYKVNDIVTTEFIYRQNKVAQFLGVGIWAWDTLYFGVEPESISLQLGLRHQYGSLMLQSDTSEINSAKRLSLEASLNLLF